LYWPDLRSGKYYSQENPDYDYNDDNSELETCQALPGEELVWEEKPEVAFEGEERFQCKSNYSIIHIGSVPQQLFNNGTLAVTFENEMTLYPPGMFCLYLKHTAAAAGGNEMEESADGPDLQNEAGIITECPQCAVVGPEVQWSRGPEVPRVGPPDSGVQSEAGIITEYLVCETDGLRDEAKFTSRFYHIPIFISAFFILLTIIVYLLLTDNCSKLFGKLTIGFLINVLLAFFFSGVHFSLNVAENQEWLNTPFCKALGYIVQHTWLSFFLWMSAMAINITITFAQGFKAKGQGKKQTTALTLNILYAQGIPLVITVITLIMDRQRPNGAILPNMGQFSCFLGSEYSKVPEAFYKTPVFLYFYLAISVIIVINVICLAITGGHIINHWTQMKEMQKNGLSQGVVAQARILGNLFVIMGIPWIFEIISAYLGHAFPGTYKLRVALDIVNLLQGILIFIALVCKVQVLETLKASLSSSCGIGGGVTGEIPC
jgi:hypothetical protein